MNYLEILEKCRAVIADPDKWTQGVGARDCHGQAVHPSSPDAVRWCAAGVIQTLALLSGHEWARLLRKLSAGWDRMVVEVNDELGHEAVLVMYDRAIANERVRNMDPSLRVSYYEN